MDKLHTTHKGRVIAKKQTFSKEDNRSIDFMQLALDIIAYNKGMTEAKQISYIVSCLKIAYFNGKVDNGKEVDQIIERSFS